MTTQHPATFADMLRRRRREMGLSQEELAHRADLSARTIGDIERSVNTRPHRETVRLLCEAPEVSVDERDRFESAARQSPLGPTPDAFPRHVSYDHNLPVQATSFIGREREVEAVRGMLLHHDVRLITLIGPGGTGKTRLAIRAAESVLGHFDDGVHFVDLAPIADHGLVTSQIARSFGLREAPDKPLEALISAHLGTKHALLVLDNFEHVLEAGEVVPKLLAASPRLKVMVTSRAPLRVRGEREYPVSSLSTPGPPPPPLEILAHYDAIRLFVQRARDVKPEFTLTSENAPAVAKICARLDGLPLAIELAASRIRLFPPQALLARLGNRLGLLTGGARDVSRRQQTLRATIDWSYDLISEEDKALFARLSVFAGGRTLEAIEAVCDPDGGLDVLAAVESLVEKSLLRQEEGTGGEPRFVMLETIQEYAGERLDQCGERDAVRRRHARYFLSLAEEANPELLGPLQVEWLDRLETEHDNLRAALSWTLERGEAGLALRLAGSLAEFWGLRGYWSEARRWLEDALTGSSGVRVPMRAEAIRVAGELAWGQGDRERATALWEESLALAREMGDKRREARALSNLGWTAVLQGKYERATTLAEESLPLARELGGKGGVAAPLTIMGWLAVLRGEYERATTFWEEDLVLLRKAGEKWSLAQALPNLGWVSRLQGEYERATKLLEEALALARELGNKQGVAGNLCEVGWVAVQQGAYERATMFLKESLALAQELGYKEILARDLEGVATISVRQDQPARAARLLGAADALREALGTPLPLAERTDYERDLAAARVKLDETEWEAAWSQGRSMGSERAAEYALGGDLPP